MHSNFTAAGPAPLTTLLEPKTLLSLPPELILHIIHLASHSFVDPFARQRQRFTHDSINKLCFNLGSIHGDTYAVTSYQMASRAAHTLLDNPRRLQRARQLVLDLRVEVRSGMPSSAGKFMLQAPALRAVAILLPGKEDARGAPGTVGIGCMASSPG